MTGWPRPSVLRVALARRHIRLDSYPSDGQESTTRIGRDPGCRPGMILYSTIWTRAASCSGAKSAMNYAGSGPCCLGGGVSVRETARNQGGCGYRHQQAQDKASACRREASGVPRRLTDAMWHRIEGLPRQGRLKCPVLVLTAAAVPSVHRTRRRRNPFRRHSFDFR